MMKVSVCIGSACHIKGSYNVIHCFQEMIEEHALAEQVELKAVFCLGRCTKAVSVQLEGVEEPFSVTGAGAREFFKREIMGRL